MVVVILMNMEMIKLTSFFIHDMIVYDSHDVLLYVEKLHLSVY